MKMRSGAIVVLSSWCCEEKACECFLIVEDSFDMWKKVAVTSKRIEELNRSNEKTWKIRALTL